MEIDIFNYFIDPNKRIYWVFILSSLLIALIYLWINPKYKKINFSKALWLNPSAVLDYYYFILSAIIKAMIIIPIVISIETVSMFVNNTLINIFGFTRIMRFNYFEIMIMFTISIFVFSDFTRYWVHRLMHKVEFLWEFHKIHHSARVLNPFTFYRVHPVENLIFGLRYSLSSGLISGIFIYFFGYLINIYDVLGVNIISYIFMLLGSNLRHSHIPMAYNKFIENLFISPKQHQIHHSVNNSNNNFGGALAIWDFMFGTLIKSKEVNRLKFGLKKNENSNYKNIFSLIFFPFLSIYVKYKKKRKLKKKVISPSYN